MIQQDRAERPVFDKKTKIQCFILFAGGGLCICGSQVYEGALYCLFSRTRCVKSWDESESEDAKTSVVVSRSPSTSGRQSSSDSAEWSSSESWSGAGRLSPECWTIVPREVGPATGTIEWYWRTSRGRYLNMKVAIFRRLVTSVEENGVAEESGTASLRR